MGGWLRERAVVDADAPTRRLVTLALLGIAAVLVVATTMGPFLTVIAFLAATGLLALAMLGRETTAIGIFAIAFATAPMYRGIPGLPGGFATPTDILIVLAMVLLLPDLLTRRTVIPPAFVVAVVVIGVLGLRSSAISAGPAESYMLLVQWLFFLAVLPVFMGLWSPTTQTIVCFLWCYLAGHALSTLVALGEGPLVNNRYIGLTHHSNAFAIAGATSIAAIFYLFRHHQGIRARAVLACLAASSLLSIVLSGSRAATVVVVVLFLMLPVVERSALGGFLLAGLVCAGLLVGPLLLGASDKGTSLSRLAGEGTAAASDSVRGEGIGDGLQRFLDAPILGSGLDGLVTIHNVFLEVAVGIGVVGLAAYLVSLYYLARPLFGQHPQRRLAWCTWVFLGLAAAVPSLIDRTLWLPLSLAMIPVVVSATRDRDPVAGAGP